MRARLNEELLFAVILTAIGAFFVVSAATYSSKARFVPLVIGIPTVAMALYQVVKLLRAAPPDHTCETAEDEDLVPCADDEVTRASEGRSLAWVVGCFASIWFFGFLIGLPLYAFLYAKVRGREGWLLSIVPAAVAFAVLYGVFFHGLHVPLYKGFLPQLLNG